MFGQLHLVALEGSVAKAQSLIENGEDPNQTDIQGMSPLHKAARHGHQHLCSFLIEKATPCFRGPMCATVHEQCVSRSERNSDT